MKNHSKLADVPDVPLIYKSVNIWVGLHGYAVPKNIKVAIIRFRIETSWINDNGLSTGDIILQRWDGSKWVKLETYERSADDRFTYFESSTDSFSPFVIAGAKKEQTLMEVLLTPHKNTMENPKNPSKKTSQNSQKERSSFLMNWFLISGIFVVIGLIIEVYVMKKKRNDRNIIT